MYCLVCFILGFHNSWINLFFLMESKKIAKDCPSRDSVDPQFLPPVSDEPNRFKSHHSWKHRKQLLVLAGGHMTQGALILSKTHFRSSSPDRIKKAEYRELTVMAHSHCTGPGQGMGQGTGMGRGPGMMGLCIFLCNVHTTRGQGQGMGARTIGFHTHFPVPGPGPVPGPVQCE